MSAGANDVWCAIAFDHPTAPVIIADSVRKVTSSGVRERITITTTVLVGAYAGTVFHMAPHIKPVGADDGYIYGPGSHRYRVVRP